MKKFNALKCEMHGTGNKAMVQGILKQGFWILQLNHLLLINSGVFNDF
jgi:hypothetical protein